MAATKAKKKPRQRTLPTMQDARDKALERLVEVFLNSRDVWKDSRKHMDDARAQIQTKMLALGIEKYTFDGHTVEVVRGEVKVQVTKQKEGGG